MKTVKTALSFMYPTQPHPYLQKVVNDKNFASLFQVTPFGDDPLMIMLQQRKFDEVLNICKSGGYPLRKKDWCRFSLAQMALLCGATDDQMAQFITIDMQNEIPSFSATANGGYNLAMIAANMVKLQDLLKVIESNAKVTNGWIQTGYAHRNLAHALFLPCPQKGQPTTENFINFAKTLLENGVDFYAKDDFGYTPLDYQRTYFPNIDLTSLNFPKEIDNDSVVNKDQMVDFWGLNAAQYAVMFGQVDILRTLIENQANLGDNTTQQSLLHTACAMFYLNEETIIDIIDMLLPLETRLSQEGGAVLQNKPDLNGSFPILYTLNFGIKDAFLKLSEYRPNGIDAYGDLYGEIKDSQDRNCAHYLCMAGPASSEMRIELADLIILKMGNAELFKKVDCFGISPLVYAIFNAPELAKHIISKGEFKLTYIEKYLNDPKEANLNNCKHEIKMLINPQCEKDITKAIKNAGRITIMREQPELGREQQFQIA